eukprot:5640543-Pleurochrysis_carterae.AAC.1
MNQNIYMTRQKAYRAQAEEKRRFSHSVAMSERWIHRPRQRASQASFLKRLTDVRRVNKSATTLYSYSRFPLNPFHERHIHERYNVRHQTSFARAGDPGEEPRSWRGRAITIRLRTVTLRPYDALRYGNETFTTAQCSNIETLRYVTVL